MSVHEGTGLRIGLVVAVITDDGGADLSVDVLWGPWQWRSDGT